MEFAQVIVVGGGAAGLGAAKTLGASTDYLLLEAADYLGGRIRTIDAGCCSSSLSIHVSCSFPLSSMDSSECRSRYGKSLANEDRFSRLIDAAHINRVHNLFMDKQIILFMKYVTN